MSEWRKEKEDQVTQGNGSKAERVKNESYRGRRKLEWYLTFSIIRNRLMKRLVQYAIKPMKTRQIRATWLSHI